MGGDASGVFDICDCDGGSVCGGGDGARRSGDSESVGECGVVSGDVLSFVFLFEGEVSGGRRLVVVFGDWVASGGLAFGVSGVVFSEFLRFAGDVAEEEKENGVWTVFGGGVCGGAGVFGLDAGHAIAGTLVEFAVEFVVDFS